MELPAGQRDVGGGEDGPGLVDDEDGGRDGGQVPVGVQAPQVTQLSFEGLFHYIKEEAEEKKDPDSLGHTSLVIFHI